MRQPLRLAGLWGALFGLTLVLALFGLALTRESPGGAGENLMWLLTYATIVGLPLSLLTSPFISALLSMGAPVAMLYSVLLLSVPLNWALVVMSGSWLWWAASRTDQQPGQ